MTADDSRPHTTARIALDRTQAENDARATRHRLAAIVAALLVAIAAVLAVLTDWR